jgi:RHS repeat-associated protein
MDLIAQTRGTGVSAASSFYHYDGLGSTRALTSSAAAVTDRYTYDAFGAISSETGTTENAYRFTGEQLDPGIQMYYLRARYYDPSVGRFTTMDTWGGNDQLPASLNKYNYCGGNSVNWVDPSGHAPYSMIEVGTVMMVTSILAGVANASYQGFTQYLSNPHDKEKIAEAAAGGYLAGFEAGFTVGSFFLPGGGATTAATKMSNFASTVSAWKSGGAGAVKVLSQEVQATFEYGQYVGGVSTKAMKLFRVEGGETRAFGRYFSFSKPANAYEAEILYNLPEGNTMASLSTYIAPEGTVMYVGKVAGGEGIQVFISTPVAEEVELISTVPFDLGF